jgi:hypothetical protein
MSKLTELFLQLLDDAEIQNPDSEAVSTFRNILETMNIEVESKMTDADCDTTTNATVFENSDHPEVILTALDALNGFCITEAVNLGVSENINHTYNLESTLSLNFTRSDTFDLDNDVEHSLLLIKENFIDFDEELNEENINQFISNVFDKKVLGHKLYELETIFNDGKYPDDIIVAINLSGKEFVVQDLIKESINEGYLELTTDQLL